MASQLQKAADKKNIFFLALFLLLSFKGVSQAIKWEVISPIPNSHSVNENLFIAAKINPEYNFGSPSQVKVYLDNQLITGNLKLNGNKLQFLYPNPITNGIHEIRIEAAVEGMQAVITRWTFFEGTSSAGTGAAADGGKKAPAVTLMGLLTVDNRNEYITGFGSDLRQEPSYTRNLSLDAALKYKNAIIPVKVFLTSNNRFAQQSMNYYQVGFKNKWLEIEAGDLNPNFDQLILTGVRVRGGSVKFKYRANSLEVAYGQMNQAYEGSLQTYVPGVGVIPTNLINDTQYVAPGTYRRMMTSVRLELGNVKDIFKFGLTSMKAKDDQTSIKYGLAPKDNLVNGLDLSLKLFKKTVLFQAGAAGSVFTENAALGTVSKETLDTTYGIQTGIDPKSLDWLVTMNTSTIPLSFDNTNYLAYYTKVNYNNKYQNLFIEYRKNGPLFRSLGNPFLRTNYEGITISERVPLMKRKIVLGATYMNYTNSLNQNLGNKVRTQVYKASAAINPGKNLPSFYLSYLGQTRKGTAKQETVLNTDDNSTNYMINIDYAKNFWKIDHHFRVMFSMNKRKDMIRSQNNITTYNGSIGLNENFGSRYNLNVEFGKTLLKNKDEDKLSDINTYSLAFDWQIKPEKLFTTLTVSNNQVFATIYSEESYRLATGLRLSYRFWRGMGVDVEGGYQPYRSKSNLNSYDESYFYVRYLCDLGSLF
jgi:hypothetical protein